MNKEEIKKEYLLKLSDRFNHVDDPYKDIAGWALTDFITEFIVEKITNPVIKEEKT